MLDMRQLSPGSSHAWSWMRLLLVGVVTEHDLGAVQVGDAVQVRVSAFPERVFAAV